MGPDLLAGRTALVTVAAAESAKLSRGNSPPKERPSHLGSAQAASRPNNSPPRSQSKDDQSLRSEPIYASRRRRSSSPKPSNSRSARFDILVANAGVGRVASYEEVDGALFDETLAVNLRAPYLLARHALHGLTHYFAPRVAPDGVTV